MKEAVLAHSIPFFCATSSAIAMISGTFFPLISCPKALSSLTSPSASTPNVLKYIRASLNLICLMVGNLKSYH
jgi:hypothetical protein